MRPTPQSGLLAALAAALVLVGCAVQPKMSDKSTVYVDAWAKRNNPEVYVEPLKAPPVPLAPLRLIHASLTVGVWLSTLALVVSTVVLLLPASSVAVTDTLRLLASTTPEVRL